MNDATRTPKGPEAKRPQKRKSLSMHEGVAVWCDVCPCEAEPYWAEVASDLGIDLSDYEPEEEGEEGGRQQ